MSIRLSRKLFGDKVEKQATLWLGKQGLTLLNRNYYCRWGEIDIIMEDSTYLVFIEVRYRKQSQYGSPAETVTERKQEKIRLTAEHFLLSHSQHHRKNCRFDVIAAQPGSSSDKLSFNWIRNAF
jgi:putative endonuclease